MGDRAPYVVGILAIAGVVAWLVLRDEDGDRPRPPAATGSGSAPSRADSRGPLSAPEGPTLSGGFGGSETPSPELREPPAPTADEVFSEETRDDAWADTTEAEIVQRWKKIRGGKLESTECRQSQCRLVVAGAQSDVGQSIADLEGSRGMHGFAKNVHLTSPEQRADGSIALRVFVRFDR